MTIDLGSCQHDYVELHIVFLVVAGAGAPWCSPVCFFGFGATFFFFECQQIDYHEQ